MLNVSEDIFAGFNVLMRGLGALKGGMLVGFSILVGVGVIVWCFFW